MKKLWSTGLLSVLIAATSGPAVAQADPVGTQAIRVTTLEREVRELQDQLRKLGSAHEAVVRTEDATQSEGKLSSPAPTRPAVASAAQTTPNPAEDAYMAGYGLWMGKKYPEAEAALKDVVAKYPQSRRASYAQNLLGRAYLDEGKPALAAKALFQNYQKMPQGERARDSLYYLGQSLMQLSKPAEACKVYGELSRAYGAKIVEPLKSRVARAKTDAKCAN